MSWINPVHKCVIYCEDTGCTSGSHSVVRLSIGICDQFPGDPWIHFCMLTLKFTYIYKKRNNVLLKIIDELIWLAMCYFVWYLEYIWLRNSLYPQNKRQSVIKVKSCNALLRTLFVYIRSYLKSVLRYTFLILDTYHPDNIYLRVQWCEDSWLFFEAKSGPRAKTLGKHWAIRYKVLSLSLTVQTARKLFQPFHSPLLPFAIQGLSLSIILLLSP